MIYHGLDLGEHDLTVFAIYNFVSENYKIFEFFQMNEILYCGGRAQGRTELWVRSLKSAIKARPDKKLVIGCTDQEVMLKLLRVHFPKALFELVSNYGVSIHLRE